MLGRSAIESGQRALDEIEAGEWVALVVTGKPFVFAAGADIDEFPRVPTREAAIAGSRAGHDLFGRLRALPFPTVAAVNGVCLGGGLEVALHCDARTIASSVRHFGAPECFLGIIPAWGGTQLVPRLVGAQTAVRVIVENAMRQNRMLRAAEAVELGLADRMLEPVEFLDESIAYALELVEQGGMQREPADLGDAAEVTARARAQLDASLHGAAPAPYRALDLIEGAAPGASRRATAPRRKPPPTCCSRRRRAPRSTRSTSSSGARGAGPGSPTPRRAASGRSASSAPG